MQGVAVATDDLFGLRHLPLKSGIVGSQLVAAVWRFDQEQGALALVRSRLTTSFGRTTPSELPTLRTLSSTMERLLIGYYYCNNIIGVA